MSLLAVELLTAFALGLLWLSDRRRTYTLWWAIAHVAMALPALLTPLSRGYEPLTLTFAATTLMVTLRPICLLAGVISYRTGQVQLRHVLIALTALFLLTYLPTLAGSRDWVRATVPLFMVVALLATAALMWSLGRFERIAAFFLLLRCAYEVTLLALIINGQRDSPLFNHFSSFNALTATGTALALLVAAYQHSLTQLRHQYRILELAQEMTAQLQGVTNEQQLAQRVLTLLAQRLNWEQGICFALTSERLLLEPVSTFGVPPELARQTSIRVPDTGLLSTAMRTQRLCYTADLRGEAHVAEFQRGNSLLTDPLSQVVIPVVHDGKVLSLIVLRDGKRHELHHTDILTLESLGQVIGLSVANARNLRELAHRANHDALTGLGNRAALHDHAREAMKQHPDHHGVVMLFDLDHFKQVNDALGHAVGDQLLQALAERLLRHFADRPARLFRLGGDEFVVLHRVDASHPPLAVAQELADLIAQPLQIGELSLRTPASIGVAIGSDHGGDSHELLRCADVAMYHAKQHGTGVTLYERAIDAHKLEHLTLLSAVNEGLEKGEFELFYQPILNLASGAIEGCEGLIRWRHPTLGLIGAAEFMPLIEATDLIRAITRRVIDIAMCDTARWQQRGIDARVAINLSARNILDPELPGYLLQSAARHRVEPGSIQLELTETILIKDPASAGKVMQQLTEAGFTLALDDFGTGYSSLAYLARFPIHTLKIDRSFVREMLSHPQSCTIVESTIALARGLGLQVTAEGVEQEAEAELLRGLGCDYAQGYLFSRPLPAAQITALWLQAWDLSRGQPDAAHDKSAQTSPTASLLMPATDRH